MDCNRKNHSVNSFNRDVLNNNGYLYTTNFSLSSYLANRRYTDVTLGSVDLYNKRVVDIGCGDGTYTIELFDRGQPTIMYGIDPACEAIRTAQQKIGSRKIHFDLLNSNLLPYETNSFDIVLLRGTLHHMEEPIQGLREALRVAPTLMIIEPNGHNPILKVIERFSTYHIKHNEKSYSPAVLDRWINSVGGVVLTRRFVGLVPFFAPDWFARALKIIEPAVEKCPLINSFLCAVCVLVAVRANQ